MRKVVKKISFICLFSLMLILFIGLLERNILKIEITPVTEKSLERKKLANPKVAYDSTNTFFLTVDEYDKELKNKYQDDKVFTPEYELLLLQRTFVNNVSYSTLQNFINLSSENAETIKWLMSDLNVLREYVTGGEPIGSYDKSLKVLNQLYHTYQDDLKDSAISVSGKMQKDIYLKMMISLSLTHSTNIGLWIGGSSGTVNGPNDGNPVTRYASYKDLYINHLLDNEIFENLSVEEMRWVMNNDIDEEEIKWLNYYSKLEKNGSRNPYHYTFYQYGYNYWLDNYYDLKEYNTWNLKYNLSKYQITYKKGYPKLWIAFEQGAMSEGLSRMGSNLNSVYGIPSTIINQPNHTAYLVYDKTSDGEGKWSLGNSSASWLNSEKKERMLNGWGSSNWSSRYQTSYVLLSQAALNDLENYKKAEELVSLARIYSDDFLMSEKLCREALKIQPINLDAWHQLIQIYTASNRTEKEFYSLAVEISDNLTYYPLPMLDLLKTIEKKFTTPSYSINSILLEKYTLEKAAKVTSKNTLQYHDTQIIAKGLLEQQDFSIATFSFNGKEANTILFSADNSSEVSWEYSLDGGRTWKKANSSKHKLTDDEIKLIGSDKDIKLHIVGTDYFDRNIYTIDIQDSTFPSNLYGNDLENRIIGVNGILEWRYSSEQTWTSYATKEPDLDGEKSVVVRVGAHSTYLPSKESKTFVFTEDRNPETKKYVPISRLSISDFSNQSLENNGLATMAIDGNLNTGWITDGNELDKNRYIVIKLDRPIYLSSLQYVPMNSNANGIVKEAVISVSMDNKNWIKVASTSNWDSTMNTKVIDLKESTAALYVKFETSHSQNLNGGFSNYTVAAMINLFEDATKRDIPIASIEYDITDRTSSNVVAKLVNPSTNITILNNDGKDTYVFKDNGEFTFHFVDSKGVEGSVTAKVNWIDKTIPSFSLSYDITGKTNQNVIATVNLSKGVKVINNGGKNSYTFTKNGEFKFVFMDEIGNKGTAVARVNWIDKESPKATITYDIQKATNKSVVATIQLEDGAFITNNNGENTYTFDGNGTFEFQFEDELGNKGAATARVSWIDKENPVGSISYSTVDPTNQDVTVKLTDLSENVTILNNAGEDTYTFQENGEFTFEFVDAAGNKGTATASVDWIDREILISEVTYDITVVTNQNVVATMDFEEGTKILNNNGSPTYTFSKNGRFIFEFVTKEGKKGKATARVDWIDTDTPIAEIVYDNQEQTEGNVVATLANVSENIVILNNNGKDTYTFTSNGEFIFEFIDEAGNEGKAIARVNWLKDSVPKTDIEKPFQEIEKSKINQKEIIASVIDSSDKEEIVDIPNQVQSNIKEADVKPTKGKDKRLLLLAISLTLLLIAIVYISGKITHDKKSIF